MFLQSFSNYTTERNYSSISVITQKTSLILCYFTIAFFPGPNSVYIAKTPWISECFCPDRNRNFRPKVRRRGSVLPMSCKRFMQHLRNHSTSFALRFQYHLLIVVFFCFVHNLQHMFLCIIYTFRRPDDCCGNFA